MGFRFRLEHASIIGWLTRRDFPFPLLEKYCFEDLYFHYKHFAREILEYESSETWKAPRVKRNSLLSFLDALPHSIVSSNEEYQQTLLRMAKTARSRLDYQDKNVEDRTEDILSSDEIARILAPIRSFFVFPFYFLCLGRDVTFEAFRKTPGYTLWLVCEDFPRHKADAIQDLLDPFPPIRNLFRESRSEKGTLCWNWAGDSAVFSGNDVPLDELMMIAREVPPWALWPQLKKLQQKKVQDFNLLQLSDLHFGANTTPRRMAYIEQHLRDRIEKAHSDGGIVQPIVTGDLVDTPNVKNLAEFEAFRNRLTDSARTKVICIPGNHDVRIKGFLWRKWQVLAGLEWSSVVSSDICKVVFTCFDTSKDANLALGKITADQFLEVATKLTELKRVGDFSEYVFLTLVHHHPFSTSDDEIDTLPVFSIRSEPYLRMENGDQLVRWCAGNRIPLILHGHRHQPRFIGQEIEIEGRTRLVRAVGCGSTFGIGDRPLSYNWITWQPASRNWMVSFIADSGDGSGFSEKRLVIGAAPD